MAIAVDDQMAPLLTPQEVSELLKVKVPRIYEAVKERRLRSVKIGRLLRFRPQDIEEFLSRHTTKPAR